MITKENIDYIKSNYTYTQILNKYIDIYLLIRRDGFSNLDKSDEPLELFIYNLFKHYYDLENSCDNPQEELNKYIESLLVHSRLRDILFMFVDMIANYDGFYYVKIYCHAMDVEADYFDKTNPLEWFDDSFADELELTKGEIYQKIKSKGWSSAENQIESLKNIPIKLCLHLLLDMPHYDTMKRFFKLNKIHTIWYIKENYPNDAEEKIKLFESYWEEILKLVSFYETNIEKVQYKIEKE